MPRAAAAGLVISTLLTALFGYQVVRTMTEIAAEQVTSWTQDHAADCAVVLTGGRSRIREGIRLLSLKRIRKLIISGVHPQASLIEIFPQWHFYGDTSKDDVILERRSQTTYGNAQQSLPLVEALQCRDIILITSRLHMRRALKSFMAVFPEHFPIYPRSVLGTDFYPTDSHLWQEAVKSVFYSLWAY